MDDSILELMLFGSLLLGTLGLIGFLWGLKTSQFDDEKKFTHALLYDGEDELNEAAKNANKLKEHAALKETPKQ